MDGRIEQQRRSLELETAVYSMLLNPGVKETPLEIEFTIPFNDDNFARLLAQLTNLVIGIDHKNTLINQQKMLLSLADLIMQHPVLNQIVVENIANSDGETLLLVDNNMFPDGSRFLLRYKDVVLPLTNQLPNGYISEDKHTFSDFIKQIAIQFPEILGHYLEGLEDTNDFEILNKRLAAISDFIQDIWDIVNYRYTLLILNIQNSSGINQYLENKLKQTKLNKISLSKLAIEKIRNALEANDTYSLVRLYRSVRNSAALTDEEKELGNEFFEIMYSANGMLNDYEKANPEEAKCIDDELSLDDEIHRLNKFMGKIGPYNPGLGGSEYSFFNLHTFISSFETIIKNSWNYDNLKYFLKEALKSSEDFISDAVFVRMQFPLRGNITLFVEKNSEGVFIKVKMSFAPIANKGTEKDPYNSDLRVGFNY